jgi:dTDP-4-amino-4,6-dideoxygalactose transaminase
MLRRRGVETRVHYPTPIHLTEAWTDLGYRVGDFPHAERAASEVLSIPVYPELTSAQVAAVAGALRVVAASEAQPDEDRTGTRSGSLLGPALS